MTQARTPSRFGPFTSPPSAAAVDEPTSAALCVTCGQPAGTPFCPHCGERRASDHAYTLRTIVAEVWDHVTPADGKSLRSIWTLVRRPGALTTAYMRGVRQPYLSPLRLFLLVNAAFFAYASFIGQRVLSTPLANHVQFGPLAHVARSMVDARIATRGITLDAYARRFDATAETQAKTLVVVMVPMFALVVAAVQIRRRRRALHHLAFGFHTIAALLCYFMGPFTLVMVPIEIAVRTGKLPISAAHFDEVISTPLILILWAWLAFGLREAYGDGRWSAAAKGAALVAGFFYVLTAYRALLFFTTFWAT